MKLNSIQRPAGAVKEKSRVGRGVATGSGKTSGRGHKGQKSRSGYSSKAGFEGGQLMLFRRLPKFGFTNAPFKVIYETINVSDLEKFENGAVITPELLREMGIIKNKTNGIKVLGNGELTKKITVKADKFSKKAVEKIENIGGKAEVI